MHLPRLLARADEFDDIAERRHDEHLDRLGQHRTADDHTETR
jgi:hypothetical protein